MDRIGGYALLTGVMTLGVIVLAALRARNQYIGRHIESLLPFVQFTLLPASELTYLLLGRATVVLGAATALIGIGAAALWIGVLRSAASNRPQRLEAALYGLVPLLLAVLYFVGLDR